MGNQTPPRQLTLGPLSHFVVAGFFRESNRLRTPVFIVVTS